MDRDTLWQLFQRTGLPQAYTLMAQVPLEETSEKIRGEGIPTEIKMGHTSQ